MRLNPRQSRFCLHGHIIVVLLVCHFNLIFIIIVQRSQYLFTLGLVNSFFAYICATTFAQKPLACGNINIRGSQWFTFRLSKRAVIFFHIYRKQMDSFGIYLVNRVVNWKNLLGNWVLQLIEQDHFMTPKEREMNFTKNVSKQPLNFTEPQVNKMVVCIFNQDCEKVNTFRDHSCDKFDEL